MDRPGFLDFVRSRSSAGFKFPGCRTRSHCRAYAHWAASKSILRRVAADPGPHCRSDVASLRTRCRRARPAVTVTTHDSTFSRRDQLSKQGCAGGRWRRKFRLSLSSRQLRASSRSESFRVISEGPTEFTESLRLALRTPDSKTDSELPVQCPCGHIVSESSLPVTRQITVTVMVRQPSIFLTVSPDSELSLSMALRGSGSESNLKARPRPGGPSQLCGSIGKRCH